MALDRRRVMTHEELQALYVRLNQLIHQASDMQLRLGKALAHARGRDAGPVTPSRRPKLARRSGGADSKSRN
jgi:hypothetical protein